MKMTGRLKIALLDADKEFFFANRFGVQAVPRFILYRNGAKVDELKGAPIKEQLFAWLDAAVQA
jgi:thioredoxin-like negative regulator of GroEL